MSKTHRLATGLLLAGLSAPAWAYLDPGSVSLWLQGLIAAVAAGAATFRLWWYRLKSLFRRGARQEERTDSTSGRG